MSVSVGEVEHEPDREPEAESFPRVPGRPRITKPAGEHADAARRARRTGTLNGRGRFGSFTRSTSTPPQTRMNAKSVPMLVRSYVSAASPIADAHATTIPVTSVVVYGIRVLGIDARGPLRKQAVARHREEDARLAVLEDQQHRRERDDGAERDDPADASVKPASIERVAPADRRRRGPSTAPCRRARCRR